MKSTPWHSGQRAHIITHPEARKLVEARCRNLLAHFGESADPDLPLDPQWRELA